MPRIIAGSARGIRLTVPEGSDTRPTADNRKEAIFSSIQADLPFSRFLDLFSGCGAAGLEARSRGADEVVLVESAPAAIRAIRDNIARSRLDQVRLMECDVYAALARLAAAGETFDVIFLDPPYDLGHEQRVVDTVSRLGLLKPEGCIVIESSIRTFIEPGPGLVIEKNKEYRITRFTVLRKTEEQQ